MLMEVLALFYTIQLTPDKGTEKMERIIDLKSFIEKYNYSKRVILNRLKKDGVCKVNIWGAGESGEAITVLLDSTSIEILNYYDSFRSGSFLGNPIKNPFNEIQNNVPVLIASSKQPEALREITDFLEVKKVTYYLLNLNNESRIELNNFKDKHKNKRCFVMGNGPSLNQLDMTKLKNEITFGANRCFLGFDNWGFKTTYWTIEDKLVAEDVQDQWNDLKGPVKFIPKDLYHLVTNYNNVCSVNFSRENFEKKRMVPRFSNNALEMFWGGTVTYLMIQLAVLMGCNPIYLIGVDFYYIKPDHVTEGVKKNEWISHGDDPNHFHPDYFGKNRKWHDPMVDRMGKAYIASKNYADMNGLCIQNATPGTKLDIFDKVDFSSLF